VDDLDKLLSFDAGEARRSSTSSLVRNLHIQFKAKRASSIKVAAILVLIACVLGIATLEVIAHQLPSRVSDGFALPGAVTGMLGSIVGLYDIPSGPWAIVCMIGNFLFYAALWWVLMRFVHRRLTIGSSDRGGPSSVSQGEGR
jgi:hypothetical protein